MNTGIIPSETTEIEVVVRVTPNSPGVQWPYLLGSQTYNDNPDTVGVRGGGRPWAMYRFGHSSWISIGDGDEPWGGSDAWHIIKLSKSRLEVDGVAYNASASNSGTYCSYPLAVGSINRSGKYQNCIPHDLKSVKIWNAGILVRDMHPVIKNNIAGMIDNITSSFFASALDTH